MAILFKTPDQIAQDYLDNLKVLKPEINRDQTDSDWYVRGKVTGGVVAGAYADQKKIADDAFPQSARREAIQKSLYTYFNRDFFPATQADGLVIVSADPGSDPLPAGTQMTYAPNGNVYLTTEELDLGVSPTGTVAVQSVSTGQAQNLLAGAILQISSPPAGFDPTGTVGSDGLANGSDAETTEAASAKILARIQTPLAGGTESDYVQYAQDADPSVGTVKPLRYIYGPGTMGLYFTAGTKDIDTALDSGDAIVRIPSSELIQTVRDYVDAKNPATDTIYVYPAVEVSQDVSVRVKWAAGMTGSSVISGQTLTLSQLLQREVQRALYKVPVGGRMLGATGFVIASEIEEVIDQALSAAPYTEGSIAAVIADRRVLDLTPVATNRELQFNEIVTPGTITVIEL